MKNMLQLFAWLMIINMNDLWASNTYSEGIETVINNMSKLGLRVYEIPKVIADKVLDFTVDNNPVGGIPVSAYALSLLPQKFRDLMKFDPKQATISLLEVDQFKYFAYFIHFIHDRDFFKDKELSVDDLKPLILMAEEYDFNKLKKQLLKKLIKIIDIPNIDIINKIKIADFCLLHLNGCKCPKVEKKAEQFLIDQFKEIRVIFTDKIKKEEFMKLSPESLLAWVQSLKLIIDSEGSVFYLFMLWLTKAGEEGRLSYFYDIVNHIDFYGMKKEYLLDIVKYNKLKKLEEGHIKVLGNKANEALIALLMNKKESPRRQLLPDRDKVMIKCVYQEVNKWKESGKYYSSPVLIHGYEFYYFLQRQKNANDHNDHNDHYGMAGFLRCSGEIIPGSHYLPIQYSVVVITPKDENRERKFSPMRVIFEDPEKAIGGKLTIGRESWEDIVQGRSSIVNRNNTMTIIVTIEFLPDDNGCLSMDKQVNEPVPAN